MARLALVLAAVVLTVLPVSAQERVANPFGKGAPVEATTEAVMDGNTDVDAILRRSRASYDGVCGCPEDLDRSGRRCGKRSAYSKTGGAALLCYPSDIR
jgi:hypothetical protein